MKRKSGEEDIVSKLPDEVLCHVLSFLTIKEATATSLLSTRWRYLWTMVLSLNIDCSKPIMKFYRTALTFLGRRTEKITRFHLNCNNTYHCCSRHLEEWVSAVIARKVEQVNISCFACHLTLLSFPALYTCTTIVTLKIHGCFDLSIPSSVHLPNVKTLHLHINSIGIPFFLSVRNLVSGSPALELFHLRQKRYSLKIVRNSRVVQLFQRIGFYYLVIHSDRACDFIPDYLEDNLPNVVKAKVYISLYDVYKHPRLEPCVFWILNGLRNVEFLSLGDFMGEMNPCTLYLPRFKNLVELRLFLKNANSIFMQLPAKSPKLQVLEVNVIDDRYDINQRCRYRVSRGVREYDLSIVPV